MPARSDLELDMINYSVTMNNYTIDFEIGLSNSLRFGLMS
jgi:hypothetical protein